MIYVPNSIHLVAASDQVAVVFGLSAGHSHDAPEGRKFLATIGSETVINGVHKIKLIADKAYEDDQTRKLIVDKSFDPVVPSKSNRKQSWSYDKEI